MSMVNVRTGSWSRGRLLAPRLVVALGSGNVVHEVRVGVVAPGAAR